MNSVLAIFQLSLFANNQCLRFLNQNLLQSQYQQWND